MVAGWGRGARRQRPHEAAGHSRQRVGRLPPPLRPITGCTGTSRPPTVTPVSLQRAAHVGCERPGLPAAVAAPCSAPTTRYYDEALVEAAPARRAPKSRRRRVPLPPLPPPLTPPAAHLPPALPPSIRPRPQLLDQIFNLKFTSKQLVRAARKCEKEEKDEKLKIKKAIEKGAWVGAGQGGVFLVAGHSRHAALGGCRIRSCKQELPAVANKQVGGPTARLRAPRCCRRRPPHHAWPPASPRPCRQHGRRQDLRAECDPQEERGAQLPAPGQPTGRGRLPPRPAGQDAGAAGRAISGYLPCSVGPNGGSRGSLSCLESLTA